MAVHTKPLVSIIMPAYNVDRYIEHAIKSVLAQTYKNIELIVIDDHSADSTRQVVRKLITKRTKDILSLHELEYNGGVSNARNIGLNYADGEFITFLDSDDWIEPDYIENLIKPVLKRIKEQLKKNTYDVDNPMPLVLTDYISEYSNSSDIMHFDIPQLGTLEEMVKAVELFSCPWGKLYQASIIKRMQLRFDTTQKTGVEDVQFVMKYAIRCDRLMRQVYSDDRSVEYVSMSKLHWLQNSLGLTYTMNAFPDVVKAFRDLFGFIQSLDDREMYRRVLTTMYRKQVNLWGVLRSIKHGGSISDIKGDLIYINSGAGFNLSHETIDAYEQLSSANKKKPIKECNVYVFTQKLLLATDKQNIRKMLKHISSEVKWHIDTVKEQPKDVKISTVANAMRSKGYEYAILLNADDILRKVYMEDMQQAVNGIVDNAILIPVDRICIGFDKDTKHIDMLTIEKYNKIEPKSVADVLGGLIVLRDECEELEYIRTDSYGYLREYADIYNTL